MDRRMSAPSRLTVTALTVAAVVAWDVRSAAAGETPTQRARARCERIARAFLASRWDALRRELPVPEDERELLTPSQRKDLEYVRETLAQCRPAWWKAAKGTKRAKFRVQLWGRKLPVTYVPSEKPGLQMHTIAGVPEITVSWNPSPLDSTEPASRSARGGGFTLGDKAELGVWGTLANGYLYATLGLRKIRTLHEQDKAGFARYGVFRENAGTLYHGSPRARHAALTIYLGAFLPKYGADPYGGCRRAIGSMFVAEVLADPSRYPSLPLPRGAPSGGAEQAAAIHYRSHMAADGSVAEDRALREAILAFATKNDQTVLDSGKVVLPNALVTMLDPEKDGPLRPQRDAWVARQLRKARRRGE